MAISLGFHIIFAEIGIAMPLMMVLAEWRWRRTGERAYLELARRWAKGTAMLFAVGAVSGTVLSFELGLLWPGFMQLRRSDHRHAVLARGIRLLPRGHLPRHLPLRVGPRRPARAPRGRRRRGGERCGVRRVRRARERLDERTDRIHPRRGGRLRDDRSRGRDAEPGRVPAGAAHAARRVRRDRHGGGRRARAHAAARRGARLPSARAHAWRCSSARPRRCCSRFPAT